MMKPEADRNAAHRRHGRCLQIAFAMHVVQYAQWQIIGDIVRTAMTRTFPADNANRWPPWMTEMRDARMQLLAERRDLREQRDDGACAIEARRNELEENIKELSKELKRNTL